MIARSAPPAGAIIHAHSPRRLAGWQLRRQFAVAATAVLFSAPCPGSRWQQTAQHPVTLFTGLTAPWRR